METDAQSKIYFGITESAADIPPAFSTVMNVMQTNLGPWQ